MNVARGRPPDGGGGGPGQLMANKLTSFAEAAGLDADTTFTLQRDIKAAMGTAMANSPGEPPARTTVESALSGVLNDYGLDADAFFSELEASGPADGAGPYLAPATGGGPGMMHSQLSATDASTDLAGWLASLDIELLDELA